MLQIIKRALSFIYAALLFYGWIFLLNLIGGTTI